LDLLDVKKAKLIFDHIYYLYASLRKERKSNNWEIRKFDFSARIEILALSEIHKMRNYP
jgi:hypothetical protein